MIVIGVKLLNKARFRSRDFFLLAGILVLKPFVTIPVANDYVGSTRQPSMMLFFVALLPEALITTLAVLVSRPVFSSDYASKARILVALDWARMVNLILFFSLYPAHKGFLGFIVFAFPIVYAFIARKLASEVEIADWKHYNHSARDTETS
jgi:hypothetical protein